MGGFQLEKTHSPRTRDYKSFTATCFAADMNPIRGAPAIAAFPDAR
jgi:hypothetical protein